MLFVCFGIIQCIVSHTCTYTHINTQTQTQISTHTYAHISWRKAGWASLHCVHFMFTCADFIKASKHSVYGASGSNSSACTTVFCRMQFEVFMLGLAAVNNGAQYMQAVFMVQCVQWTNKQKIEAPTHPASAREPAASLCRVLGNNLTLL